MDIYPTLPGGKPILPSNVYLCPVFDPTGVIITHNVEYTTDIVAHDEKTGTASSAHDAEVHTYQAVRDYKALIEEIKEYFQLSTDGLFRSKRTHQLTFMYYDTTAYKHAKEEYQKYVKQASCYNSNQSNPNVDNRPPEYVFLFMQWADFPFAEMYEEIGWYETEDGPKLDEVRVRMKGYICDLASGMHLREVQMVYVSERKTDVRYMAAANIYNTYRHLQYLKFGEVSRIHGIQFALESQEIITYVPLTPRVIRVVRSVNVNESGQLFEEEYEDKIIPPVVLLKTSVSSQVQMSPAPRLSRVNLLDSQARLGRFNGGDEAAKLTARKIGETITSTIVDFMVQGVNEGKIIYTADKIIAEYTSLMQSRDSLQNTINDIISEVSNGSSIVFRRVASRTATKLTKVNTILQLYTVRYEPDDVAVFAGFIDNAASIVTAYEDEVITYIKLMACQKNLQTDIAIKAWQEFHKVSSSTGALKWIEKSTEDSGGAFPYEYDQTVRVYDTYVNFRRRMARAEAEMLQAQRDLNTKEFCQVSVSLVNYFDELLVGDKAQVNSIREQYTGIVKSVSFSINATSIRASAELRDI